MREKCFTLCLVKIYCFNLHPIRGEAKVIMNCEWKVRRGEPDSRRCFHHQEDVNRITKGPPERSAKKQLDPHLQHINCMPYTYFTDHNN